MNKITTLAAVLLVGTVVGGPAALAQTAPDQDGFLHRHPGMMGGGYGHHGWLQGPGAMSSTMMRIIFSLMDADGDGKLTLQEWQAAHERIFKAMDTDHDGTVTLEEMQTFMRGR